MLEAGWPLHHVQRMLGHADVKQTATYLNAENVGLHDSMKRFGTTPAWHSPSTTVDETLLAETQPRDMLEQAVN
jgi:hypothetical protein